MLAERKSLELTLLKLINVQHVEQYNTYPTVSPIRERNINAATHSGAVCLPKVVNVSILTGLSRYKHTCRRRYFRYVSLVTSPSKL